MTFNQLFLVYVAMLPLWSLVALLVGVDTDGLRARFSPKLPPCGLSKLMSEGDLKYADITITELEYNVTGRQEHYRAGQSSKRWRSEITSPPRT